METKQIKSKERVASHGEVFTAEREVNAMLDLVKEETERIESRFLEPACGNGNFLAEILRRKLAVVVKRYGGKGRESDYEQWSVIAVMNIYGVELLADNAQECRERLYDIWNNAYIDHCGKEPEPDCREAVRFILKKNILCGDALTMKQDDGSPIIFAEWSFVTGTKVKRRDFRFDELLENKTPQRSLWESTDGWEYDEETKAYIPAPLKEYPPTDYRKVQNDDRSNRGEKA